MQINTDFFFKSAKGSFISNRETLAPVYSSFPNSKIAKRVVNFQPEKVVKDADIKYKNSTSKLFSSGIQINRTIKLNTTSSSGVYTSYCSELFGSVNFSVNLVALSSSSSTMDIAQFNTIIEYDNSTGYLKITLKNNNDANYDFTNNVCKFNIIASKLNMIMYFNACN